MAITADTDRPLVEAVREDRKTFTWGMMTSLVLHALFGLVLLGGISGYVTEPTQDPVDVEIVTVPAPQLPDPAEEDAAVEEPAASEEKTEDLPPEPAPQEEETEEVETEETPPEPAPAPEEEQVTDNQPPPAIQEAVQEFAEEASEPQERDLQPLQETEEEVSTEDNAPEINETEPLEMAQEIADPGAEDSDVAEAAADEASEEDVAADATEDAVADEELQQENLPEQEVDETQETTPEEPSETLVAEDADPLAGPADDTVTNVTPEPHPKPVELAEAGTEAATDVGDADEIASDDFGTVGPIVTAAAPAPKPARHVARATASSSPSSSAGTVRRPGHIQARQIFSSNNPRLQSRMRGLTEGERLSLLCTTELDAQLTAVSPVPPEFLPRVRTRGGTVLEARRVAFRSLGRWFDVAFRCETNGGVTRVERFSFKIGEEIPQSQWLSRGLTQ